MVSMPSMLVYAYLLRDSISNKPPNCGSSASSSTLNISKSVSVGRIAPKLTQATSRVATLVCGSEPAPPIAELRRASADARHRVLALLADRTRVSAALLVLAEDVIE